MHRGTGVSSEVLRTVSLPGILVSMKGKAVAIGSGTAALAILAAAALAFLDPLRDEWFVWRAGSSDWTTSMAACRSLLARNPARAIPLVLGKVREEQARRAREAREASRRKAPVRGSDRYPGRVQSIIDGFTGLMALGFIVPSGLETWELLQGAVEADPVRCLPGLSAVIARGDGDAGRHAVVLAVAAGIPSREMAEVVLAGAVSPKSDVRSVAVRVLEDRPKLVRENLLLALSAFRADDGARPRLAAVLAAARVDPALFVPDLVRDLGASPDPALLRETIAALERLGPPPEAAGPLAALLGSTDRGARFLAGHALARLRSDAVPVLAAALADPSPIVRRGAAAVLEEVARDAEAAVPSLKEAADDLYPEVREAARSALKRIEAVR